MLQVRVISLLSPLGADEIGKTSEAKGDMARLQEVRRRREAAAKQREAEAAGTYALVPI